MVPELRVHANTNARAEQRSMPHHSVRSDADVRIEHGTGTDHRFSTNPRHPTSAIVGMANGVAELGLAHHRVILDPRLATDRGSAVDHRKRADDHTELDGNGAPFTVPI